MINERQTEIIGEIRSMLDAIVASRSDEITEVLVGFVKKSINRFIPNTRPYREIYENEGPITAIKKYRRDSGLRLLEAKQDIEAAAKEGGWKNY